MIIFRPVTMVTMIWWPGFWKPQWPQKDSGQWSLITEGVVCMMGWLCLPRIQNQAALSWWWLWKPAFLKRRRRERKENQHEEWREQLSKEAAPLGLTARARPSKGICDEKVTGKQPGLLQRPRQLALCPEGTELCLVGNSFVIGGWGRISL